MPDPDCIVCRIAARTIPAEIVMKTERLVGFRAIAPIRPAIHGVKRIGFAFTGTHSAHVQGHVVPLVAPDDLTSRRCIAEEVVTLCNPPGPVPHELAAMSARIAAALAQTKPREAP